jgi:hypothetical protein
MGLEARDDVVVVVEADEAFAALLGSGGAGYFNTNAAGQIYE